MLRSMFTYVVVQVDDSSNLIPNLHTNAFVELSSQFVMNHVKQLSVGELTVGILKLVI
jgi:hypothetical protein